MSKASDSFSNFVFREFGILISKVIKEFLQNLSSGKKFGWKVSNMNDGDNEENKGTEECCLEAKITRSKG